MRPPPKKPQHFAALLRCPPEIRNAIYEELFQGAHSIFLTSQPCHPHLIRVIKGINLLATCRQIHAEASGVLYSRNRFVAEYDQWRLKQWTRNIGNSRILLRSLDIDLGVESHFQYLPEQLYVSMLFYEAWTQPSTDLEILFAIRESEDQLPSPAGALSLNRMLAALRPNASPHLKPLARCESLLDEVWLSKDGRYLSFQMYNTHFFGGYSRDDSPSVECELDNAGRLVRTTRQSPTPSLMGVWDCTPVQGRLLRLLSPLPPVVEVDLDKRVISKPLSSLVQVNRKFRSLFLGRRPSYNHWSSQNKEVAFMINITTDNSISTFARFIALREWITAGRPQKFGDCNGPRWYGKTLRISLNFKLDAFTPLEDLRIEVTDLVFSSFALSPETSLLVQYQPHDGQACTRSVERGRSTLYRLRRALLVFLSDIMASHPGLRPGQLPQV
jgi:hypothetical protein